MFSRLQDALQADSLLLLDGATGTNLFLKGLQSGNAPEFWNVDQPEDILGLHQSFVQAGSDLILTNSFGANARRLMLHKAEDRVIELNEASAKLALQATKVADRDVFVLGSVGPTGDLMFPLGELTLEEAEECFYQQAIGLSEGGVDGFWIETLSAIDEASAAVKGILRANKNLPIFLSMSFDTAGNTMMGIRPENFANLLHSENIQVTGYGANCGLGPAELLQTIIAIRDNMQINQENTPYLLAKSNYGIPEFKQGKFHYHGTNEMMAQYVKHCADLGVKIAGGCCGTEPNTIAVMREAIDQHVIRELDAEKRQEIEDFISNNLGARSINPASRAPTDHSASGRRSGSRSRSRRRQ